ncbi:hypothetical protein ABEB36_014231 [Hypothenemus hampei]|uniref:Nucleoporin p54 n=1 Tax=Hypothenemus hampei TaxID=57062 RepID=A0ABD1E3Q1_HYPHA
MAFSFGSSGTPAFGNPTQKPTGFATPFGAAPPQPAAPTQPATFGFGQSQFGSTTFGSAPTNAPPAFGVTATTTAPSVFGSPFGSTPASSAASAFGSFGQTGSGLFSTAKPQGGGTLFGAPATSGTGLFGTTTSSTGLFGASVMQTTSAPSLFGNTPSLFGQTATTTNTGTGLFGGGTAQTFSGGLFGAQTSAPSLFGTAATTTMTSSGFGGFGSGAGLFGSKPLQTNATQDVLTKNQQVMASVYMINVFNDERDDILKKWNLLQACWGTGKGYFSTTQPPVEYTPQNPFYRFKAMGYNVIPEHDNSEGVVKLVFNKKIADVRNQQDVLKNGLAGILGNQSTLTVDILLIKALSENHTEVKICITEKQVTGSSRKIPATDLAAYLNQPQQKQQLMNVGVTTVTPFVTPSKAELEEYFKNPLPGIDQQMWQAAVQDNPNPKKYIPVPMNGFSELRSRLLNQEYQTGLHSAFLEKVKKDIEDLKKRHANSTSQISDLKQKFLELQHRILRVLVKQESTRKAGMALQPEEEILKGRLELLYAQLNGPKQIKGQINELLSHVKMMQNAPKQTPQYWIDTEAQEEIKQYLKMEQNGIAQLVSIVNNDLKCLQIIRDGLKELTERRHVL